MKKVKNISQEAWNTGISKLKERTFPQNKYRSLMLIEKTSPISLFSFYGLVSEQGFVVSPVVLGINKLVVVFSSQYIQKNNNVSLAIRVQIAPIIRNAIIAVYSWFGICLSIAYLFGKQALDVQFEIAFLMIATIILASWILLIKHSIKKGAEKYLPVLERYFV